MDTPRIYVASLSDYNAGNLLGKWIDLTDGKSAEDIHAEVAAMLATSTHEPAEEWAIHDYELPGGIKISEWESFEVLAALAQALEKVGEHQADAFAVWYANCEPDDDDKKNPDALEEKFRNAFMGTADTFKDWLTSNDTDVLGIDQLTEFIKDAEKSHYGPKWASEYFEKITYVIDWDMVARDHEPDYTVVKYDGTAYIFTSN